MSIKYLACPYERRDNGIGKSAINLLCRADQLRGEGGTCGGMTMGEQVNYG